MTRKTHGSELRSVGRLRAAVFLPLLAVLFASALAPASAETRTETRNYLGVEDWVCNGYFYTENPGCFDLNGTEKVVTLTLADATGFENAYAKVWFLKDGEPIPNTTKLVCGSTTLSIPPGATQVEVNPSWVGAVWAPYCMPATKGTITAVFTS